MHKTIKEQTPLEIAQTYWQKATFTEIASALTKVSKAYMQLYAVTAIANGQMSVKEAADLLWTNAQGVKKLIEEHNAKI